MAVRAGGPHRLDRRLAVDERDRSRSARDERVSKLSDVDAQPSEHLTRQPFDVEHAEQNVLGGHVWLLVFAREPACSFERTLCPGREWHRFAVRRSSACSQRFDHLVARSRERCTGSAQHVGRLSIVVRQQPEKQVLGANS